MNEGRAKPHAQRWLVLSHAFNMDGRAASQTITDKLPHLEAAGIEVVVLSGVSGRKDTRVEHYQLWPLGPAGFRFELRHVLRKHLASPVVYRLVMLACSLPLLPFMLIEKLIRPVESSWSWWLGAYLKGLLLGRKGPFDLIYSTGGAFAAHTAAYSLKRSLGVRWLAEVHDPMVMPKGTPRNAQQRMQAKVERIICTHADVAIWFTDQALASAKHRHPALGMRGKSMLPGIDAPFKHLPLYQRGEKLVVGHFGSLSNTRNLVPVIDAMERLSSAAPQVLASLELHVYGSPLDSVSSEYLQRSAVRQHVRHFGRVEADPITGKTGRELILQRMRAVDVLLLLHGTEPVCAEYIPSKMYEYLWMQRPILATVHQNPQMKAILQEEGHTVVDVSSSEATAQADVSTGLSQALQALWARWSSQGLNDSGRQSPHTTLASAHQMLQWALAPQGAKA